MYTRYDFITKVFKPDSAFVFPTHDEFRKKAWIVSRVDKYEQPLLTYSKLLDGVF